MKRLCLSALAAAAFAPLSSASAEIIATFDLRVAGQTGPAAKIVQITQPNQVVHLEAYISVVNANGNSADDAVLAVSFSFLSTETADSPVGNYANGLRNSALFQGGTVASNGIPNNLDGNPDLEWGSTSGNSTVGNMYPSNPLFVYQTGSDLLIGTIDWVGPADISNLSSSTLLSVKYFRNISTGRAFATLLSDGVGYSLATSALDADSVFGLGAPVVVTAVPEPATLGILALGGLALLARRRKTA